MRISDWRDVCSSDLSEANHQTHDAAHAHQAFAGQTCFSGRKRRLPLASGSWSRGGCGSPQQRAWICEAVSLRPSYDAQGRSRLDDQDPRVPERSEEHTSELKSLMRISSAVFCLKKKKK